MCNKIILLSLIGILFGISNGALAQDEPEKTKSTSNFLTPSSKQIGEVIPPGEVIPLKTAPPLKEAEILPPQQNLPNPEIEIVNGIKCANNGEYDKAIEIFNGITTKYPNTQAAKDAQYMIDRIHHEQQKPLLVAQSKPPTEIEIPKEQYPDYQFNLGLKYYQEKNFKEALVCFQNVVNTAPEGSKLSHEAGDAIKKIQRRLTPIPEPTPIPHFTIPEEKKKRIEQDFYERAIQKQEESFAQAMKLKNEGKLQEALQALGQIMNSRSTPVLDKVYEEIVKIKKELEK